MKHFNRPKHVIAGTLSLIYLVCGLYIGCDQKKEKKKTTPPAGKTLETPPTEKTDPKTEDSGNTKGEKDAEDSESKGASSEDEENSDGDSKVSASSGSKSTKGGVTLQFTSMAKARAFCSIPSNTLLNLVRSLDGMSSSDLKEIANSKIGQLFTYDQIKGFKSLAGTIKLSQINSLKSQVCKTVNSGGKGEKVPEEEQVEEVEEEVVDEN